MILISAPLTPFVQTAACRGRQIDVFEPETRAMIRLASMIFGLAGTVLAGAGIMVILAVPAWSSRAMSLIPWTVVGALVLAAPVSIVIARSIVANGRQNA